MLGIENCLADQWSMVDLWGNLIVPVLPGVFKAGKPNCTDAIRIA
jgi:hypothetical protein